MKWNNADPRVESGDTTSRLYAPCSNPIGGSPLMYVVGRGRQTNLDGQDDELTQRKKILTSFWELVD